MMGIVTGNVNYCRGGIPDVYNFIGNKKVNISNFVLALTGAQGVKIYIHSGTFCSIIM